MFPTTALLSAVLLALSVAASPVEVRDTAPTISLPFALHLNLSGSTLPELDRIRATHLIQKGLQHDTINRRNDENDEDDEDDDVTLPLELSQRESSISVTNTAVSYVTSVKIGSPPTSYTLLIDTGSSNTWVGANKAYKSRTSINTGNSVAVNYGSGQFEGTEYTDTVALSPSLVINQQSIGVASSSTGFSKADGILGLGPVALTEDTVSGTSQVPTVADNLYSKKKISTEVLGVSYNPTASYSVANGELTFGGVDSSKYTGDITYASITEASPAKHYWGLDQSISYGSSGSTVLSSTAGILDTGTTLILLATDAFDQYKSLTGATLDSATGLLKLTSAQYAKLQSLYFTVGDSKFELTANAQIWPRSLNQYVGGTYGNIYLIIGDLGRNSGQGLDFISGYSFLKRFYSVYDTTYERIGLATTPNTKLVSGKAVRGGGGWSSVYALPASLPPPPPALAERPVTMKAWASNANGVAKVDSVDVPMTPKSNESAAEATKLTFKIKLDVAAIPTPPATAENLPAPAPAATPRSSNLAKDPSEEKSVKAPQVLYQDLSADSVQFVEGGVSIVGVDRILENSADGERKGMFIHVE